MSRARWCTSAAVLGAVALCGWPASAAASTWTLKAPATAPSARFGMAFAYDAAAGVNVAFGGAAYGASSWGSASSIDPGDSPQGVACPTDSFCMLVDGSGDALTYNGSSWSAPQSVDAGGDLYAVSCPTASFCAASDGNGSLFTYNGTTWSGPSHVDGTNAVRGVSCASASFCVAVDNAGNAITYNGSTWGGPVSIDGTNPLYGVSCPTTSFCEAVGLNGHAIAYTGTWGAASNIDAGGTLSGVSCPTATLCEAVDESGYATAYNGTTWSAPSQIDSSAGLYGVSCPATTMCVAVDGAGHDLTFNGSSWSGTTTIDGTNALSAVACASATFCAAVDDSGDAVLFAATISYDADTWTYKTTGDAWTKKAPASAPSARAGAAMAYDSATSQIVLFGGSNGSTTDSDTWLYSEASDTWTLQAPSTAPSARTGASMAYDSATGQIVLFGGMSGSTYDSDTWLYNPATDTWTAESPSTHPSARAGAALGYGTAAGRVVLFGGASGSGYDADTWLYDPSSDTWTAQSPATSPSARGYAASATDATEMVLFGGASAGGDLSDTWAYRGGDWVAQAPTTSPSAREGAALVYDATASKLALFGGRDGSTDTDTGDTWTATFTTLVLQTPGTLAWSPTLTGLDLTSDAPASLTVTDSAGLGWNLQVVETTLTSGAYTLPDLILNGSAAAASSTAAPAVSCAGATGTCTTPTGNLASYPMTVPTGTAAVFYSAASGTGTDGVSLALDWWLTVPGSAHRGTYTNKLTLTLGSGP